MLPDALRAMNPRGSAESEYLGGKADPRWVEANKAYNLAMSGADAVFKTSLEAQCASVCAFPPNAAELAQGIVQLKLHPNAKTSTA